MTSIAHPAPTHERRSLFAVTLLVLAAHALLILGLPFWGSAGMPGLGTTTLITRTIAAGPPAADSATEPPAAEPEPEPEPAPPPEPEPEPVPVVPPAPEPPTPAEPPQADTTPAPDAAAPPPRPRAAPRPRRAARSATAQSSKAGATSASSAAGTGDDRELSILAMPPPPQFGPFPAPGPIETRPGEADAQALRASIQGDSDAPALPPHPAKITYRVTGHIGELAINVPSALDWRHDGQHYVANWAFYHVKAGERSRYANGLITPQGLAPVNSWQRTDRKREMAFDYGSQLLRFGDGAPDEPLAPGSQDALSMVLQLSAMVNAAPDRYPAGSSVSLPMARIGAPATDWRVVVEDEETIEGLRGQPLRTLRLKHHSRQDDDPQVELWLAPALEHLPARMRVTEANGDVLDYTVQQAWGVKVLPPPPESPASPAAPPAQ